MMSLVLDKPTEPRVKRWTKREYNELVDLGAFRDQRVYLFRGELIEMPPMEQPHALAVTKLTRLLVRIFDDKYDVRIQLPFDAPGQSMPEPDTAVCTAEMAQRSPHPNSAVLVVEISDSSLELDREKAFDYAAAGVPDYWAVDLNGRQIEVYQQPVQDSVAPLGFRHASKRFAVIGESLAPLAMPSALIAVADMLG